MFLTDISLFVLTGVVMNGWVLSILWGWYFVPYGLPPLTVPRAMGIALMVSFLTHRYTSEELVDESFSTSLFYLGTHVVLRPLSGLALGGLIRVLL